MLLNILLTIHIIVCIALIGVILLQRSEGGAFGMGGGGGGGFMTARGAGDLLTRTTAILAGIFFILSLALTLLSGGSTGGSVADRLDIGKLKQAPAAPAGPAVPAPGGLQVPAPGNAPLSVPPAGAAQQPADPFAIPPAAPQPTNR
jgi:preprotein translocase subunit SecG